MSCDIIVPVWDQLEFTKNCLESIYENTEYPFKLIVIDNNSGKKTEEYLRNFRDKDNDRVVLVRNKKNLGFVKASNQGLKRSSGEYVCLLNNDTIVTRNWISNMISIFHNNPKIGIINPIWQGVKGGTPQKCADLLQVNKGKFMEVNDCMGFCFLIKREVIDKIGYLDEIFGMGGKEDSDYCKRAVIEGFRCVRAKDTFVYHYENASFSRAKNWRKDRETNERIFEQKWGKRKQVVFILDDNFLDIEQLIDKLKMCLSLARVGVRVHVWMFLNGKSKAMDKEYLRLNDIVEHNNIKYAYFFYPRIGFLRDMIRPIFYLFCLIKLASRRNKSDINKYRAVFVVNRALNGFLNGLKFLHRVKIFNRAESVAPIQREIEWIRNIEEKKFHVAGEVRQT